MAFWLWIALAIVVLFAIIGALLSRIRVRVRYSRSGRLDQLVVIVHALYGLFQYEAITPSIIVRGWNVVYREKTEGGWGNDRYGKERKRKIGWRAVRRNARSYRLMLRSARNFKRWARRAMRKVECTRWRLDFRVGTGDAASTATVAGLLWAVSGCASGIAGQYVTFRTSPHGEVAPNYASPEFSVVWEADFRIRLGTAIAAMIRLAASGVRIGQAMKIWRGWMAPPKESMN
ncbi:DUF2953 domain-containing protein [Paenibacillaceae bacterium WGS1546]|uniref:DUF2953 domain-containing protein n=1 Tax=Cohnella sp. WGS1546 TaxID=3366810 RepID=UPI00372D3AD4